MFDYLIVGAGLFGAVFAREMTDAGKSCIVIDRRNHIAGNVYTERIEKINVHRYGAHIFHTNDKEVWDFAGRFASFNRYTNSPVANFEGEIYNLPFNMNTFNKMWGVITPSQAEKKIEEQRQAALSRLAGVTENDSANEAEKKIRAFEPSNLEEQAISLVGTDIYEKLINGYTQKQWGRRCSELPAFIIKRLPVRFTYDNNYFNALFQGIPEGGYTEMVNRMLEGITVVLNTDYLNELSLYKEGKKLNMLSGYSCEDAEASSEGLGIAKKVVFTGPVDEYFGYSLGALMYRSVRFETETLDTPNYQGNAVVNYTDAKTPYTRVIEHKHFEFGKDENGDEIPKTIISREYSAEWKPGDEPYYPVNDEKNSALYLKYKELADKEENVIFGGRLGEYKYYDMDQIIRSALDAVKAQS